jgi:hypothetical protein
MNSIDKDSINKDRIDKERSYKDRLETMAILIELLSLLIDSFYGEHAGDELEPHPTRKKAKVERVRQELMKHKLLKHELRKQELPKKVPAPSSAPIAFSLEIRQRANGSAEVRIDHGNQITLSKTPAELLTILAGGDIGEDGLVHWKTPDEIGHQLGARLHRDFTRETVNQNVYLLRKALSKVGADGWWLVQRDSINGYRFALRREAPKVVEGLVRSH